MNRTELIDFAEKFYSANIALMKIKNADYTGSSDNAMANFIAVEVLGIEPEKGFLTRMMDKMMRVSAFVKQGKFLVEDESVQVTLSDLANYCALMAAYLATERKKNSEDFL